MVELRLDNKEWRRGAGGRVLPANLLFPAALRPGCGRSTRRRCCAGWRRAHEHMPLPAPAWESGTGASCPGGAKAPRSVPKSPHAALVSRVPTPFQRPGRPDFQRHGRGVVGRQTARRAQGRRGSLRLRNFLPEHLFQRRHGYPARAQQHWHRAVEADDRGFHPTRQGPPSRIMSTCSPNSARTCSAVVGLTRPKRLAEGAANPLSAPMFRSSASATGWKSVV